MFQLYEIYNETKNENYELVIAVGGGSVLDVGKSLCCLYAKPVDSLEAMRNMIAAKTYSKPHCKWIGIPTTAGTGSEVTCWATVWDSEHNKKIFCRYAGQLRLRSCYRPCAGIVHAG